MSDEHADLIARARYRIRIDPPGADAELCGELLVALRSTVAERDALAARLDKILDAIGDPDELRWHRWHCEATGSGDDLRELLVRIADAADPDKSEHGNLRPLTAEDEAIIEDVRRSVQPDPDTNRSTDG